jgi:hypothetical protein
MGITTRKGDNMSAALEARIKSLEQRLDEQRREAAVMRRLLGARVAQEELISGEWTALPGQVEVVNPAPEELRLTLGPLVIELNRQCMGKVTYRGRSVEITALRIEGKVGEDFRVSLDPCMIGD